MNNKLRSQLAFIIFGFMSLFIVVPQTVMAATSTVPNFFYLFSTDLGNADPRLIVARLISVAMGFLGIIFLVMILASGLAYMTSGGNEEKVKSAKRIFINAVIGVIIILMAYSVVYFVINTLNIANN